MSSNPYLELADWRRRVAELYARWREDAATDPAAATRSFRAARDELFATHPQSPVPESQRGVPGSGPQWWPYDPAWRMTVAFEPMEEVGPHDQLDRPMSAVPVSGGGSHTVRRIGRVELVGPLAGHALPVLWIEGYGNGLFLPFRDATNGPETYGAGRYLLDTAKSADHGGDRDAGTLVLDFNLAYHPSCAWDPRWVCPLAPPDSRLPVPIPVGERLPAS
jgi:uncharacterized protein (DUF1684 family)